MQVERAASQGRAKAGRRALPADTRQDLQVERAASQGRAKARRRASPAATRQDLQATHDHSLHPWRALRALVTVVRDPERTEVGALMVNALEGRSHARHLARFAADPVGARILAEGRRLEETLTDREALMALRPGSLGRSYEAWTRAEGISAEGLLAATGCDPGSALGDDRIQRLDVRGAVAHDLWHVVTGYGRDLLGELALLHFMGIQTRNTGLILPCWLGLLSPTLGRRGRRLVFDARRRACRAAWLPVADWEALLAEPLPAVRERLRVGPPPRYTPVWRSERNPAASSADASPDMSSSPGITAAIPQEAGHRLEEEPRRP